MSVRLFDNSKNSRRISLRLNQLADRVSRVRRSKQQTCHQSTSFEKSKEYRLSKIKVNQTRDSTANLFTLWPPWLSYGVQL